MTAASGKAEGGAGLPFAILAEEMDALRRFHETAGDEGTYDVPKKMIRRLADIGLLHHISAGIYEETVFGMSVLNGDFAATPAANGPGEAGWLPIETAPRDNKRMLYLARFDDDGRLEALDFDGIWHHESESWEMPQVYYFWASAHGIEEPTHWAYQDEPLPSTPQPGMVTVPSQDALDARRYRWLRTDRHSLNDGLPFIAIAHVGGSGVSGWTDEHADKAIDAALRSGERGR